MVVPGSVHRPCCGILDSEPYKCVLGNIKSNGGCKSAPLPLSGLNVSQFRWNFWKHLQK